MFELCETLPELPDLDPQVTVRILSSAPDVILEASLPDGRTALRRVHTPAELRPTLEALATVPPSIPPPVTEPSPPTPEPKPAPPVLRLAAPVRAATSLGLELGVGLDARLEGAPAYLSLGPTAYAGLRPGKWMVALQLRWQALQGLVRGAPRGFEMGTFGIGFLVSRRLEVRPALHVDLGVSTSLLVQNQEFLPHGGGEDDEVGAATVDARLGPSVRALFGRGPWRFTVGLDADLSPVRLQRPHRIDPAMPYLPTYGFGLTLGACWGDSEP